MNGWGLRYGNLGGWGAVALVALLLALLGPYGTFVSMAFPMRLLYWGASAVLITLLVRAALWLLLPRLVPASWPIVAKRAVAAALAALPGGYLAGLLHRVLTGGEYTPHFFVVYAYTIVPTVLITVLLTRRQPATAPAEPLAPVPDAGATAAAFVARAAPRLRGGRLLALEAEDHYLRIHTDRGSDLVLMRLRDAVADLAGVPGLQVHRSFWVAEAGVAQVIRRGQAWQIVLAGGLAVPVSRNYGASLRAAEWPERFGMPHGISGR